MYPQRICLALLLLINTYFTNAQFGDCRTPSTGNGCNYIRNNVFAERPNPNYLPNITYDNNFHNGNVLDWAQAQNSPWGGVTNFASWNSTGATYLINNTPAPPIPQATDYAILAAVARSNSYIGTDPNGNIPLTTTIFQKIKPLTAGKEYILSFFKQLKPLTYFDSLGGLEQIKHMAKFRIVLMNCSEFVQPPTGVGIYVEPVNSEVIYEEVNLNNPNWEQVVTCFTPHANYNMIMVQPLQEDYEFNLEQGNSAARAVSFAYPQIFLKTDLSVNITEATNPASCWKRLVPNCVIIPNANYSWYLNGATTPFSTVKEPTIDASAMNGSIRLVVSLPGTNCTMETNFTISSCTRTTNVMCSESVSLNSCNYFRNNIFSLPANYNPTDMTFHTGIGEWETNETDPFGLGFINGWHPANGTANIYFNTGSFSNPLPPNGISSYISFKPDAVNEGEGIMQKIPKLQTGNTYQLSFFKRRGAQSAGADEFKIAAMKCADINFPLAAAHNYSDLILPQQHQFLYCGKKIINDDWEQVVVRFVANDNWDAVVVYATMKVQNSPSQEVLFSFPELINTTNFSAGTSVVASKPNCVVKLGPLTPNCFVKNAIFRWVRLNDGQTFPVDDPAASQQISVDASVQLNIGDWRLEMIVPGITNFNDNDCSLNNPRTIATVNLAAGNCIATVTNTMDCTPVTVTGCNLIRNNGFNAPTYNPATNPGQIGDVFGLGLVSNWQPMHGTPDIYNNTGGIMSPLPPSGVNSYVRMAALWQSQFPSDRASEGLMQKIPALQVGREYVFSFYRRKGNSSDFAGSNDPVDFFKVSLMKCSDINFPIANTNYWPPNIPASPNHQNIYCESKVINDTWEQVVVKFSATNNWDVILIYAHPTYNGPNSNSNLLFANPELIPTPVINAGPIPTATFIPDCKTLIGADNSAICRISNGIFRWKKPDGTYITQGVSQTFPQAQVNTATQAGTWTLEYVVPNAVTNYISCNTNNPLATNIIAQATVKVELCSQAPEAWPKVYNANRNLNMSISKNGSVLVYMSSSNPLINTNHVGALPATSNSANNLLQYNQSGFANWVREGSISRISYIFNSNDIQILNPFTNTSLTTSYLSGINGQLFAPQPPLTNSEIVIAELGNNNYITRNNDRIYLKVAGSTTTTINLVDMADTKFNTNTNTLSVLLWNASTNTCLVNFYRLYANQLIADGFIRLPIGINKLIVDNSNNVYYGINGQLHMMDKNGVTTGLPISINGFNNNDLSVFANHNPFTSDEFVVMNEIDKNIYYINFSLNESKKISTYNYNIKRGWYGIYQNNLFILDIFDANGNMKIGSQIISPLNGSIGNAFFTKLNLQTDFQRIATGEIKTKGSLLNNKNELKKDISKSVKVYPNPAKTSATFISDSEITSLLIMDAQGNIMKHINGGRSKRIQVDISTLTSGTYNCTLISNKVSETIKLIIAK